MTPDDIVKCADYISSSIAHIAAQGMFLEMGSDFEKLQQYIEGQSRRGGLTPKFNPRIEQLDETNAFWIIGRNAKGELAHTQAIRIMDLQGGSLAEHIARDFPNYTPPRWVLESDMADYRPGAGSRRIRGLACYHGDFWLLGGKDGFRGHGMNALTSRLAMAISLVKWRPDYLYAYMHSLIACHGMPAKGGFMHMEQNNLFWSIPGYDERLEAWMVWSSREDILHFLDASPMSLPRQLGTSLPEDFRKKQKAQKAA